MADGWIEEPANIVNTSPIWEMTSMVRVKQYDQLTKIVKARNRFTTSVFQWFNTGDFYCEIVVSGR